jgi:curved DNA-binding protein CbpA
MEGLLPQAVPFQKTTDTDYSGPKAMARIHTHYDNLKVARNAPHEVIRAAYKSLSQKYHPDRNGGSPDANRIIQIINASYEVLSDPARRREHDDWIAKAEAGGTQAEPEAKPVAPTYVTPRSSSNGRHRGRRRFSRSSRRDVAMRVLDVLDKARDAFERTCRHFMKKASRALPWRG